jgi:hypothetical protein
MIVLKQCAHILAEIVQTAASFIFTFYTLMTFGFLCLVSKRSVGVCRNIKLATFTFATQQVPSIQRLWRSSFWTPDAMHHLKLPVAFRYFHYLRQLGQKDSLSPPSFYANICDENVRKDCIR